MADAVDDTEKLFARASAAIAEARRLTEEGHVWRKTTNERVRRLHVRATFFPKSLRIFSLADFLVSATTAPSRDQPSTETDGSHNPFACPAHISFQPRDGNIASMKYFRHGRRSG